MARINADRVVVTLENVGVVDFPGKTAESAKAVSEVLQENHETHHMFFNELGYHNHIVHYMLPLWDVGAPAHLIRHHFSREKRYQLPKIDVAPKALANLSDESKWREYLGKNSHYSDFLFHFQREISTIGYEACLKARLLSGDELANDLLGRFFGGEIAFSETRGKGKRKADQMRTSPPVGAGGVIGFYHPFIHIGYGLEFKLPAIIAEGLALMATDGENWAGPFLEECEAKAKANKKAWTPPKRTIVSIMDEIRANEKLCKAPKWEDANKVIGVLERAKEDMVRLAASFVVDPEEVEERAAEAINAAAYICGAAVRSDKQIKFDFFLMHAVNSSIFLRTLLSQAWLTPSQKARLVERKVRVDVLLYVSRNSPELFVDEVRNYVPRDGPSSVNPWLNLFARAIALEDDGHALKMLRALAHGEKVCRPFLGREGFVFQGDMWVKMAAMCMDNVEEDGPKWIMGCGFDQAWENFGPRKKYTAGLDGQLKNLEVRK
ncbi:hypothetical protein RUND412_006495 [Rhizina undulata]